MTEEERKKLEEERKRIDEQLAGGTGGQSEGGQGGQDDDNDDNDDDLSSMSQEELISRIKGTRKTIKDLRNENAKRRVENKGIKESLDKVNNEFSGIKSGFAKALGLETEDQVKPEEAIGVLTQENEALRNELAFNDFAAEYGIADSKQKKYFRYLLSEASEHLEDDEELPEEKLNEILEQVQATGGQTKKSNSTTVSGSGNGGTSPTNTNEAIMKGEMTVERFAKLTTAEQGYYYQKNPQHGAKLMNEAAAKGLLGN